MFGFESRKDKKKREKERLAEFEQGKILRVDDGIDNKEFFKSLGEIEDESTKS